MNDWGRYVPLKLKLGQKVFLLPYLFIKVTNLIYLHKEKLSSYTKHKLTLRIQNNNTNKATLRNNRHHLISSSYCQYYFTLQNCDSCLTAGESEAHSNLVNTITYLIVIELGVNLSHVTLTKYRQLHLLPGQESQKQITQDHHVHLQLWAVVGVVGTWDWAQGQTFLTLYIQKCP